MYDKHECKSNKLGLLALRYGCISKVTLLKVSHFLLTISYNHPTIATSCMHSFAKPSNMSSFLPLFGMNISFQKYTMSTNCSCICCKYHIYLLFGPCATSITQLAYSTCPYFNLTSLVSPWPCHACTHLNSIRALGSNSCMSSLLSFIYIYCEFHHHEIVLFCIVLFRGLFFNLN